MHFLALTVIEFGAAEINPELESSEAVVLILPAL